MNVIERLLHRLGGSTRAIVRGNPRGIDLDPFIQLGGLALGGWGTYEIVWNGLVQKDCSSAGGRIVGALTGLAKIPASQYACSTLGAPSPNPSPSPSPTPSPSPSPGTGTVSPANGACGSSGKVYTNVLQAQSVYTAAGGGTFDSQNFVGQCAGGYVVIVKGVWL